MPVRISYHNLIPGFFWRDALTIMPGGQIRIKQGP